MDRDTIARVAKVARLDLDAEEMERYTQDLEDILNNFSVLDECPMREEYSFNPVKVVDVLREDHPEQDHDPRELRDSMRTYDDYVRGPRLA